MELKIPAFANGAPIPNQFAFCIPAAEGHVTFGPNRNPEIRWSGVPENTESLALIIVDPDVPSVGDDVNQEGKTVSADLPRVNFYHWVLVDMPVDIDHIAEAAAADGVTAGGKAPGETAFGLAGINDYTNWFASDPDMGGDYGGYDGPCPPWNDELIHHYYFRLYALDTLTLNLSGNFTGDDALAAMEGHILATAEWMGKFTLNKALL